MRRKTAQYLARAERIYESQLSQQMGGERRWSLSAAPQLPLATPATFPGSSLRGPVQELSKYKVIGVVGTVLLALDSESSNTVVIKVNISTVCFDYVQQQGGELLVDEGEFFIHTLIDTTSIYSMV